MESVAGATSERHLLNPRRGPPSNYPPLKQGKGSQGTLQNGLYGGPTGLEETQRWRVGDPLRKMRDDNEWDWWCDDEWKWMLTWNEKWKLEKLFKKQWRTNRKSRAMPQWIVTQDHSRTYNTRSHLDRFPRISAFLSKIWWTQSSSETIGMCGHMQSKFKLFCTFRRHVTLLLQHGSWLRGVQS